MEIYWEEKESERATNETRERLIVRWGSVGKKRAKDYKGTKCIMWREEEKKVTHICECEEMEDTTLVEILKEWNDDTKRENLIHKVEIRLQILNGKNSVGGGRNGKKPIERDLIVSWLRTTINMYMKRKYFLLNLYPIINGFKKFEIISREGINTY